MGQHVETIYERLFLAIGAGDKKLSSKYLFLTIFWPLFSNLNGWYLSQINSDLSGLTYVTQLFDKNCQKSGFLTQNPRKVTLEATDSLKSPRKSSN